MIKYVLLLIATSLNATANVCIKLGMKRLPEGGGLMSAAFSPMLWAGLFCFGLSLVCYATALQRLELSFAYPVMVGVGFMIVTAASVFFFGEQLTPLRAVGMGVVLVGVVLATR